MGEEPVCLILWISSGGRKKAQIVRWLEYIKPGPAWPVCVRPTGDLDAGLGGWPVQY